MYPAGELERLAQHRRRLIARSAIERAKCYIAGEELSQPVIMIEQGFALWKRVKPFLAVGALLFSRKRARRGLGALGLAMRWGPKLWSAARSFRRARDGAMAY